MSVWECIAILLSSTKVPLLPVWWDQEERRQSLTVARSKTEQYKCSAIGRCGKRVKCRMKCFYETQVYGPQDQDFDVISNLEIISPGSRTWDFTVICRYNYRYAVSAFIRSDERTHGVAVIIPTNHREIPGSTPGRYNLQIEITSKS